MATYRFEDEFLDKVAAFVAQLEFGGYPDVAADLRVAFAALTGRAGGAATFLTCVKKIESSYGKRLEPRYRATLKTIRSTAQAATQRR